MSRQDAPGPVNSEVVKMTISDALWHLQDTTDFRSERERCISIHNFVRDEISFGFTSGFERVNPEQTLKKRRGHCNAQADLFCALLNTAGIPARLRFVQIDKQILFRSVPLPIYFCLPSTLFHAVTQVCIAGVWLNTDSYIIQPAMFFHQRQLLTESGLPTGFGLTREASCEWDATKDGFCQARASDLNENNPVFATLSDALLAKAGNNTLLGIHFNQWLSCIPKPLRHAGEKYLNSKLVVEL